MLISDTSSVSHRSIIVEIKHGVCYAYLTYPHTLKPAYDVLVASSVILAQLAQAKRLLQSSGNPPPPTKAYVTPNTSKLPAHKSEVSFRWSRTGEAVIIFIQGDMQAAIAGGKVYSRAIGKLGPYGYPWDPGAIERAFSESSIQRG